MRSRLPLVFLGLFACGHAEPPQWDGSAPNVATLSTPSTTASTPSSAALPASNASTRPAPAGAAPSASVSASAPHAPPAADLPADFASLPQTREKPPPASPGLEARARALFDAILSDDPDKAMPFFFPVGAYQQVKAIAHPENDWKRRLVSAYARDIHAHAKRLGADRSRATFARLAVPDGQARWVEPHEEGNGLGYYRVYGAKIVFMVDGREESIDLTSLISWRGEWFCVHLTGFK